MATALKHKIQIDGETFEFDDSRKYSEVVGQLANLATRVNGLLKFRHDRTTYTYVVNASSRIVATVEEYDPDDLGIA